MLYSLFDLNEHLRRVVALNFPQSVWIAAEIAQIGRSRGHWYLDLVQKGTDETLVAQGQAALWAADHRRLRAALGPALDAVLQEGLAVKLRVRPDFHERYGLKLHIEDVDPAHTLGQLALQRQQALQTLKAAGLLERNRQLPLPLVLQRIAVVSSEDAAGYQDFREHIAQNAWGYRFHCRFFQAAVQGRHAESELIRALDNIRAQAADFDGAVLLRGGGARLDLAVFDALDLARTVALMPLPVFSGIGHEVDESLLDLVAHTALKTPTAVADFLLQHNVSFESQVLQLGLHLQRLGEHHAQAAHNALGNAQQHLHWAVRRRCQNAWHQLDATSQQLDQATALFRERRHRALDQANALCIALDPQKALRRGYTLTYQNGKLLRTAAETEPGTPLETKFWDGEISSRVDG